MDDLEREMWGERLECCPGLVVEPQHPLLPILGSESIRDGDGEVLDDFIGDPRVPLHFGATILMRVREGAQALKDKGDASPHRPGQMRCDELGKDYCMAIIREGSMGCAFE